MAWPWECNGKHGLSCKIICILSGETLLGLVLVGCNFNFNDGSEHCLLILEQSKEKVLASQAYIFLFKLQAVKFSTQLPNLITL